MRVLIAHNRYRSSMPSGENRVVDEEIALLRDAGLEVTSFLRDSDDLGNGIGGRLRAAPGPVYARDAVRELEATLRRQRPDVVHVHNVYPLISPWVVRVSHRARVPVVQTVHNYRHLCVKGTLFRDGQPCEDCLGRRVGWPGALHGCYRSSRPQSVAMVAGQAVHRDTWRSVDRLLPVSDFVRRQLIRGGFPPERVTVRHQGIRDVGPPTAPGSGFAFVGRLDDEKGVPDLLKAWALLDEGRSTLTVVGDGPLRHDVEQFASGREDVRVLGPVATDEVREVLRSAACVVVPSRWYEGLPRVVVEAFMMGRPVVATSIGSLADVVTEEVGWPAKAGAEGLATALRAALEQGQPEAKGAAARGRYMQHFREEACLHHLIAVYREVVAEARSPRTAS